MVAVAYRAGSSLTSNPLRAGDEQPAATTAAPKASTQPSPSPAATVELSEQSKVLLDKMKADLAAADALDDSFDEMLAKRTDKLGERLARDFAALNIPPEFATHIKVDKFGNVSAEGPWKNKIEKLFSDDPELAKELKDVAGLNALKAAQTALDMYLEEKKATSDPDKQEDAWTRYNIRSMNIQTLSGVMTIKDGKLRSAAIDYIDMLADPGGMSSAEKTKDSVNRLA